MDIDIGIGDLVQMRKMHPCGGDRWVVIRVGADVKIRCEGCARVVMMDRVDFERRVKKILSKGSVEDGCHGAGTRENQD